MPEDVVIWDYEADAYNNTNFTEWDVIGKRPYTFGIFMAYEPGLDPRTDYSRIVQRQKAIVGDTNCVGEALRIKSPRTIAAFHAVLDEMSHLAEDFD